ncbi:MAG: hypothetical protein ABSE42_02800 [Bryobacteraceae bacterium]|jgi:uncharacterized membrane protein
MPFCTQCGNPVTSYDRFCWRCGTHQPAPTVPPFGPDPLTGVSARTASVLSYVPWMGWIACIIWLASERFRQVRTVRFHAFQGLYLFVAWLMNAWVIRPLCYLSPHLPFDKLLDLALLLMSIFMMIKASRDEAYSLPLFGELAARSVAES